jgi:excinuclease ABC subunit C
MPALLDRADQILVALQAPGQSEGAELSASPKTQPKPKTKSKAEPAIDLPEEAIKVPSAVLLLRERVKEFPQQPGIYIMKGPGDKIIYVGKAKSLRSRVRSYFNESKDQTAKTRFLVSHIENVEYILTNTEVEAFLLEASLIKKHRPRYNIRLKDDKAYPYIKLTMQEMFPRFYLSRKVKKDGALYFGPYTSGQAVHGTIRFLNQTFRVRDCTDAFMRARSRPCMTHQIGRCSAPCVKLVDEAEYGQDVGGALDFLRGRNKRVVRELSTRMKEAAQAERFEVAAKLRDSIDAIEKILEKQAVVSQSERDQDVFGFFGDNRGTMIESLHLRQGRLIGHRSHFIATLDAVSEREDVREWLTSFLNQYYADNIVPDEVLLSVDLGGDVSKLLEAVLEERRGQPSRVRFATDHMGHSLVEMAETNARSRFEDYMSKSDAKRKALQTIQEKLHLPHLPQRIECYDISNFQGSEIVASQVVFEEGAPAKEHYRRYKIRTVEGAPNDFASMREVLLRRFQHSEYDDPQLIVIDGGKGQLSIACQVLKEIGRADIPVVGLAKARTQGTFQDAEVKSSEERVFLPERQNPVTFTRQNEALHILVGIRDEAHRFAITYHRKLREAVSLESELDMIVGLGEKRKRILLRKFADVEAIRAATVEEIAALPTFHRVLAERVLLQLSEGPDPEPLL